MEPWARWSHGPTGGVRLGSAVVRGSHHAAHTAQPSFRGLCGLLLRKGAAPAGVGGHWALAGRGCSAQVPAPCIAAQHLHACMPGAL